MLATIPVDWNTYYESKINRPPVDDSLIDDLEYQNDFELNEDTQPGLSSLYTSIREFDEIYNRSIPVTVSASEKYEAFVFCLLMTILTPLSAYMFYRIVIAFHG